ncbi:MAG: oxidoreductase [Aquificaceae bacterium]|nr:oxidoreductase [Aquificaceae bacterium]MCX8059742.1 oxidoreductase [Aquificaceae bacterium]MDW8096520.1 oxidoreductase [Aquificaceae bacterium]
MHPVVEKLRLSEDACLIKVQAPHVVRAEPGQFVMVQWQELSEPVPLSILETWEEGFSCLVKAVGRSTLELLEEAQSFQFVAGPLGKPFPVGHYGRVVFYTYGWGVAPALNVAKALKRLRNRVFLFHTGGELYLQKECEEVFEEVLAEEKPRELEAELYVCAGSNRLCRELSLLCPHRPIVGMANTHMLDAVGLCLVCRVLVEGRHRLACSDGPWFDAHKVDWENLLEREKTYQEQERLALEEYKRLLKRKSMRAQP